MRAKKFYVKIIDEESPSPKILTWHSWQLEEAIMGTVTVVDKYSFVCVKYLLLSVKLNRAEFIYLR
jgi:hypothetical protein